MSTSPNASNRPCSPPHLVSLVLQSKKGLQHGEQLCSRAHDITQESAREVVDVLALDAKLRWIKEGILDQLKVAAGVAKSITERRQRLEEEAKQWDDVRSRHQDGLDATLESLGSRVVPPSFHQSSLASSLFGLQATGIEMEETENFEGKSGKKPWEDRSKWKTLRDFVDERGLEDLFESIESERNALDGMLEATAAHPATIAANTNRVRELLSTSLTASLSQHIARHQLSPRSTSPPTTSTNIQPIVDRPSVQHVSSLLERLSRISTEMASHLDSLGKHYDQMATALKEKEAGQELDDSDMNVFIRDTAELPSIIGELEESIGEIEAIYKEILGAKQAYQTYLVILDRILDSLDDLGDKMEAMLQQQTAIEAETQATYETLNDYLENFITLRSTFESYQNSYNFLLLEMDRRRRYRDNMEALVEEMRQKLERLRDEEMIARETFFSVHSPFIPDDLCLAIPNPPQTFVITSQFSSGNVAEDEDHTREVLPTINDDLLAEAQRRLATLPKVSHDIQDVLITPVRPSPRREDSL